MGLGDYVVATQMRDVMSTLIRKEIQRERPRYEYAKVQTVDRASRRAYVQFAGEETEEQIALGHLFPVKRDQIVRIEGLTGDRYVSDVIGEPAIRLYSTYRGGVSGADINADTWGLAVDDEGSNSVDPDYGRQLILGPDTIQTRQGRLGVTSPLPLYINPLFDFAVDDKVNNRVQINNMILGNYNMTDDIAIIGHTSQVIIDANAPPAYSIAFSSSGEVWLNTGAETSGINLQVGSILVARVLRTGGHGRLNLSDGQLYVTKATQPDWGSMAVVAETPASGTGAWTGLSAHVPTAGTAVIWSLNNNVVAWNARNSANSGWIPIKASAFTVSSSVEEKFDIAALGDADITEKVRRLRPVRFRRPGTPCASCRGAKDPECDGCHGGDHRGVGAQKYEDSPFLGFIAEEMVGVLPEACSYDGDGNVDGVDLGSLTAVLMKMVQKHDLAITALQRRTP